ncbi:hypothetical protein FB446DRAFT_747268 [Lentinula raphanica]|uniref:DUF6534 domain-containing protein n=1 Tax=Lentinula raphanica TaxID=153919 RepID=A0AA38U861_9AGAR|nr:hypothetical protein C8R42DRAFT_672596 [Lentinula raphanica]KAJ3769605.1 hypothetical protein FB446DRAFT_747268 [Lentinula raphanica]KAJ3820512.1 hypothetical protein F5880DRAFT_1615528 [Lentinula raphanica]KAJ3833355.1 hypothetical protein F5878DRAFT_632923 [Lentinula raphanica]
MSTDIPSNVALITGPYVLGGVFSYGLFGILAVQIFFYQYTFYERDPLWLKAFVYILAIFDLVITIMWTNFMWQVLAQHWGDPAILTNVNAAAAIPLLSGIVASMAHSFYAWRIYRLTKSKFLPVPVMLLSLTTCAMAGYSGIRGAQIGIARFSEMDPEVSTWLGGSTLCDFLITFVLVFQLFRYERRSASARTRDALLRLITLTVETGLVTALTALIELLLFVFFRDNTLYFIPLFMLSKVYSNCLLANLNTRTVINTQTGSGDRHPLWVDLDETGTLLDGTKLHHIPPVPPRVHVGTTVRQDRDIELVILPDSGQDEPYERSISPSAVKTSAIDAHAESETNNTETKISRHGYLS